MGVVARIDAEAPPNYMVVAVERRTYWNGNIALFDDLADAEDLAASLNLSNDPIYKYFVYALVHPLQTNS